MVIYKTKEIFMKNFISIILFLALSLSALAQSGTVKVLEGKVVEGQFFFDKLYALDSYQDGRITLKNGEYFTGKVNISTLTQTVRIISQEGDTIRINSEKDVDVVSAGRQFFRKINNFYVQLLNTDGEVSLGLVRKMTIGKEKIEGAYGGSSEVASVTKISHVVDDTRFDRLSSASNVEYIYDELVFIVVKNKMNIATKRSFEKAFPKKKALIAKYIQENNVKFSKKEEVIPFFNYLIANN